MAWEQRGKQRYYYRTRRQGRRVLRQYVGKGPEAQQAAAEDQRRKQQRAEERASLRSLHETLEPASQLMREIEQGVQTLMQASLLAAGFHQHRGAWRRRRT